MAPTSSLEPFRLVYTYYKNIIYIYILYTVFFFNLQHFDDMAVSHSPLSRLHNWHYGLRGGAVQTTANLQQSLDT